MYVGYTSTILSCLYNVMCKLHIIVTVTVKAISCISEYCVNLSCTLCTLIGTNEQIFLVEFLYMGVVSLTQ